MNTNKISQGKSLSLYLILTFSLSWVIWIPLAAAGQPIDPAGRDLATLGPLMAGAFVPSTVGVLLEMLTKDKQGRRDFWRRVIDPSRIGPIWLLVIVLIFPALMGLTFLIQKLLGGPIPSPVGTLQTLTNPLNLLTFIVTMLLGGPLAEELGWRGFALEHMLAKWRPLPASIMLGIIHVAWHLPLFFIPGISQGAIGFATPLFWQFTVQVTASCVIFTVVYLHTRRSILSAILLHFTYNTTFTLIAQLGGALPLQIEAIRTVVMILAAMIFALIVEPHARQKQAPMQA